MASIQHRQRANGTVAYRVMFRERPGGSVVSETFDTAHQADYFKALVERIGGAAARAKRGRASTSTAPTISTVLEDYIEHALDITPGTASEYRRVLDRSGFTDLTGDLPVDLISRVDVEAWVRHRAGTVSEKTHRPIAPKTIRNEHGLLAMILGHAQARGWVPGNVAAGVRLPARDTSHIDVLTVEEFLALHAAITDHYKPLVWLLGATGMRWGEATALTWRDVDTRHLTVRQAWKHDEVSGRVIGATKTATSRRRVETDPAVIESLGKPGRPSDYVFVNTRGDRVQHSTFYTSHWNPAVTAAKVSPRPTVHCLRHFAASYMLSLGADLFEVSRALGHADISTTTRIYGHLVATRTRPTVVHAAELQARLAKRVES